MKYVCGLSRRSHHSSFLEALGIDHARSYIDNMTRSCFKRLCVNDSPTRNLCLYFIDMFIRKGVLVPGTCVARLITSGISPSSLLSTFSSHTSQTPCTADGLVDSLRTMLYSEHFIKPWSNEYLIVKLLTRSF